MVHRPTAAGTSGRRRATASCLHHGIGPKLLMRKIRVVNKNRIWSLTRILILTAIIGGIHGLLPSKVVNNAVAALLPGILLGVFIEKRLVALGYVLIVPLTYAVSFTAGDFAEAWLFPPSFLTRLQRWSLGPELRRIQVVSDLLIPPVVLILSFLASRWIRGQIVIQDGTLCPTCAYNLTGNTSMKCPECGRTYTTSSLQS